LVEPSWNDLQKKIIAVMADMLDDFEEEDIRIKSKSFDEEITNQDTFNLFMKDIEIGRDNVKHIEFTILGVYSH